MPRPCVPTMSSCSRGMDGEIVDRVGGEAVLHPLPRLAAVERRINAEVGPDEKEVWIPAILADHVDRLIRQVAGDGRPRRAVVGGLPDERLEVVVTVAGDGDVRGAGIVMRRDHAADPVTGMARDLVGDVGPRLPAVTRHLHVAIVGPGPDHAADDRRLVDGGDGRVLDVAGAIAAVGQVLRQVRADLGPRRRRGCSSAAARWHA